MKGLEMSYWNGELILRLAGNEVGFTPSSSLVDLLTGNGIFSPWFLSWFNYLIISK